MAFAWQHVGNFEGSALLLKHSSCLKSSTLGVRDEYPHLSALQVEVLALNSLASRETISTSELSKEPLHLSHLHSTWECYVISGHTNRPKWHLTDGGFENPTTFEMPAAE